MEIIKWKIRFIFETTNQLCIFPIFLGISPPVRVLDQLGGRAEGAGEALVDVLVAPAAHCFDLSFRRPREIKKIPGFFLGISLISCSFIFHRKIRMLYWVHKLDSSG
jgi:hypothetical protein